jgi:hypothetical protein
LTGELAVSSLPSVDLAIPAFGYRKIDRGFGLSPAYVRPYLKAQKDDERDAEAIAEAATRPTNDPRACYTCIGSDLPHI